MNVSDLDFESLANRYRRHWERNLKTQIRKARDKSYAAALYISLLNFFQIIHLNNPFLLELRKKWKDAEHLSMEWSEFLQLARPLRDYHRKKWEDLEKTAEINKVWEKILNADPQDFWTTSATIPIIEIPEEIPGEITVLTEIGPYDLFTDYLTEEGDKPLLKFLVRITTAERIEAHLRKEFDLSDEDLVIILKPEEEEKAEQGEEKNDKTKDDAIPSIESISAPQLNGTDEVMNAEEAAAYLNIALPTLYEKTSKKIIPHHKPGGKLIFRKKELDEWISQGRVHTKGEAEKFAFEHLRKLDEKKKRKAG